jgi:hypothetical protein
MTRYSFRAEREFGLIVGGILALLSGWWFYRGKSVNAASVTLPLGGLLIVCGLLLPRVLVYPNQQRSKERSLSGSCYLEIITRVMLFADAMKGSYLGPQYTEEEIEEFLRLKNLPYTKYSRKELPEVVADLLAAGKIIGLHQGRMEFGPRALGARSIIGDARASEMQTVMNLKIKHRESFRPFAPFSANRAGFPHIGNVRARQKRAQLIARARS